MCCVVSLYVHCDWLIALIQMFYLVQVIWKFRGATPTTLGANTKIFDWIPQNDLLGTTSQRLIC